MRELPTKWKVFKAIAILQMILVLFLLVISVGGIFYGGNGGWRFFESLCYAAMLIFLYQGLSLLNDNYPDTPLTVTQKRKFNILFLLNFLLISFLFAKLVVQWRYSWPIIRDQEASESIERLLALPLIIALLVFVLNLVQLAGMYLLRRTIQENDSRKIEDDFINQP